MTDLDDGAFTAIAFSGSLRRESANTGLVRMAARLAPAQLQVHVADWVAELPFYNPDLEAELPTLAVRWREAVAGADVVIVGLPEYNFGPSAVAKNAIDWLTRPLGTHALRGKVVALLTSGGKGGGTRVQAAVGPIIGLLGNTVVEDPAVTIALGSERISSDGTTTDPEIETLVAAKLAAVLAALTAR